MSSIHPNLYMIFPDDNERIFDFSCFIVKASKGWIKSNGKLSRIRTGGIWLCVSRMLWPMNARVFFCKMLWMKCIWIPEERWLSETGNRCSACISVQFCILRIYFSHLSHDQGTIDSLMLSWHHDTTFKQTQHFIDSAAIVRSAPRSVTKHKSFEWFIVKYVKFSINFCKKCMKISTSTMSIYSNCWLSQVTYITKAWIHTNMNTNFHSLWRHSTFQHHLDVISTPPRGCPMLAQLFWTLTSASTATDSNSDRRKIVEMAVFSSVNANLYLMRLRGSAPLFAM